MKTIGLIGGMSWESTVEYYRIINEQVKRRLGGLQSARIVMVSLNFHEVEQLQRQGKWDEATDLMIDAAKRVEKAGSDLILICTNTMHKMADQVEANIDVPLLHIVDTTAEAIKSEGLKKVGLFGTKFTMEQDFYKERLTRGHGIVVIVPESMDREVINEIIYKELCVGKIRKSSREKLKTIIRKIVEKGAKGIVLGCTELPLLLRKEDTSAALFDTCKLHAEKAVEIALQTK